MPPKPRVKMAGVSHVTEAEHQHILGLIQNIFKAKLRDNRRYPGPLIRWVMELSGRGNNVCKQIINGSFVAPATVLKEQKTRRPGGNQSLEAKHPAIIDKALEIVREINRRDPPESCYAEKVLTQLRVDHSDYMKMVRIAALKSCAYLASRSAQGALGMRRTRSASRLASSSSIGRRHRAMTLTRCRVWSGKVTNLMMKR